MATPGRLSWSKRKEAKRREEAAAIVITDSEEEKENAELEDTFGGAAPSFRNHTRSRRRESTILAGNISYQVVWNISGSRHWSVVCKVDPINL